MPRESNHWSEKKIGPNIHYEFQLCRSRNQHFIEIKNDVWNSVNLWLDWNSFQISDLTSDLSLAASEI